MDTRVETFAPASWSREKQREFWFCLGFRYCKGISPRLGAKLASTFGNVSTAADNLSEWSALKVPAKTIQAFTSKSWEKEAEREWNDVLKKGLNVLLWNDASYPDLLKEMADAPLLLYFKGDPQLFRNPAVAMVGSRNAHPGNLDIARQLASDLSAQGLTVVSGMALGVDAASHEGALIHAGGSIGVLGTGIDVI